MANNVKKTTAADVKPAAPAVPVAETVEEKKTAAKKAPVKKTAAKKTTENKKAAETKKAPAKKTAAKKPVAKKAAPKKPSVESKVYIQFYGKQITAKDVVASCEADYKSNNKAAVKTIEVYVKPEDDVAYYVVNGDVQGKVSL